MSRITSDSFHLVHTDGSSRTPPFYGGRPLRYPVWTRDSVRTCRRTRGCLVSLAEDRSAAGGSAAAPVAAAGAGVMTVTDVTVGRRLTPRQVIFSYEPSQWEEFVEEWVATLAPKYAKVERLGGANDHGVDVAAFVTDQGYEGEWDCYQCKRYSKSLAFGDACVEIAKILKGVVNKYYILPRKYRFVAPRGCSTELSNKLNNPTQLRTEFIARLAAKPPLLPGLDDAMKDRIRELAETTDFSVFKAEDLKELVASLEGTSLYVREFGGGLPRRPTVAPPPADPHPSENRYLEQLVEVHREKYGTTIASTADALQHPEASVHIRRQRVAFYSAEALRTFSRDSVPGETFQGLQDEVFDGVIDVHDARYDSGYERMDAVLKASRELQITSNALILVATTVDRRGMCHQLANDDKLTWCKSA